MKLLNLADSTEQGFRLRRTVHDFKMEAVDEGTIKKGLELALLAPNHRLTFPWKFLIVGKEARLGLLRIVLGDLTEDLKKSKEKILREKYLNPGALVAFFARSDQDVVRNKENYATLACSVQIFMTYLAACHLGSKWSTGAVTKDMRTLKLLQVDPNKYESVGFVWVGVPNKSSPRQVRPTLSEVCETFP